MNKQASDDSADANMPDDDSPFHAGEVALQQRAGVRERIDRVGRQVIRDYMPDQHREFFAALPSLLVAALDDQGHPWATMLAGSPGFVTSLDASTLRIDAAPNAHDPVTRNLKLGASVGLLGLQAHTRRRNRMNGTVSARYARGFTVQVRQSFGNCPKYIQSREPQLRTDSGQDPVCAEVRGGPLLGEDALRRVCAADTFFIASMSRDPERKSRSHGLDVSHRGGKPGFVRVDERDGHSVLTVPDFVGNFLFNTLGNLLLAPACGLLFVDYDGGGLLHLAGVAELVWEGAEIGAFTGAQRLWRLHVRESLWRPGVLPLRWTAPQYAEQLRETGSWRQADSPF